jgi:hypothetical protein
VRRGYLFSTPSNTLTPNFALPTQSPRRLPGRTNIALFALSSFSPRECRGRADGSATAAASRQCAPGAHGSATTTGVLCVRACGLHFIILVRSTSAFGAAAVNSIGWSSRAWSSRCAGHAGHTDSPCRAAGNQKKWCCRGLCEVSR